MQHSKTLKRENGTRVKIDVKLSTDSFENKVWWAVVVRVCHKGKRKFMGAPFAATDEEIKEVKKELIDLIPLN